MRGLHTIDILFEHNFVVSFYKIPLTTFDTYEPFDQSCVPNDAMGLFFIKRCNHKKQNK